MGTVAHLVVKVSASVTEFEKNIAGLEKQWARTGAKLQSVGRDLTTGITLPLAAIAVGATKTSIEFETAMTRLRTLASESAVNVGKLKDSVLALAPTVGLGPTALAEALLVIESTGFRGAEAMSILEMSAKASAIGMGDANDVARALTAAVNAYGAENLTAAQAADILTATVDAGGAEASELAGELGRVVGVAAQLGVSFEQVGAFIATYTRLGLSAAEATTGLSGALNMILNPSNEARTALAGIGMSAEGLRVAVREKGLDEALIGLLDKVRGNGDAVGALFGNVRALAGVMGTAGSQAQTYRDILAQISTSAGTLNERFSIWRTTTAATWKEFSAQVQVAAIQLGDKLAPAFSSALMAAAPLFDVFGKLLQVFSDLPQPLQTAAIGALAFGAAIGPIAWAIGNIMTAGSGFLGLLRTVGILGPAAGAGATTAATGTALFGKSLLVFAAPAAILAGLYAIGEALASVMELMRGPATLADIPQFIRNGGSPGDYAMPGYGANQGGYRKGDIGLQDEGWVDGGGIGKLLDGGAKITPVFAAAKVKLSEFEQAVRSLTARLGGTDVVDSANQWIEAIKRIGGIGNLTKEEIGSFTKEIEKAVEKLKALGQEVPRTWQIIANGAKQGEALQASRDALGKFLKPNEQTVMAPFANDQIVHAPFATNPEKTILAGLMGGPNTGAMVNQGVSQGVALGNSFLGGMKTSLFEGLPNVILGAFQGGGSVTNSIGSMFGAGLGQSLANSLPKSLTTAFGGLLGQIIPGLGALIGPLLGKMIGKLWGGIQGMFGTDEEAKLVNPARDAELAKFGVAGTGEGSGFATLAAKLTEITGEAGGGALFQALMGADTMAEFSTAMQAVQTALNGATTGVTDTTAATSGLNLELKGSDEAIAALGATQEAVVATMLAGFDALILKLGEFIAAMGVANAMALPTPPTGAAAPEFAGGAPMEGGGGGIMPADPNSPFYPFITGEQSPNLDLSQLPSFANEGMVSRPTLAIIGDAPEPEYVLRRSTVEALRAGGGGESGGGDLNVSVSVTGNTIIGTSTEFRNAVTDAVMDALKSGGKHYRNFERLSRSVVPA